MNKIKSITITKTSLRLWATCWWILPTARWRDASIDFSLMGWK